jgi:DNA-binding response OmpR family regulator
MSVDRVANVLVVDDEAHLRELLADALSGADLRVDVAASGREALDLAGRKQVDLVVTDLVLGDCTGLDVIDQLRSSLHSDIPAVVITGRGDANSLSEASRRHPVELMTKPLDLDRLREIIRTELSRRERTRRLERRYRRLRRLARRVNIERKDVHRKLEVTCADLGAAYSALSEQIANQQTLIEYQRDLLAARNDDDVFRAMFRLFVRRSGGVFGVAMACDANAELQIIGRFGVPSPDNIEFCRGIIKPIQDAVLSNPRCMLIDAGEQREMFDPPIRRYLVGLSVLVVPLIPAAGELIGLVVLYRKGEQPFVPADVSLAETIAPPTAIAVARND